jgi:hypothetical protein
VTGVLHQAFKPWQRAPFPVPLARLLHAAQADECLPARFFRTQAGTHSFVGVQCDMALNFSGEFVFPFSHRAEDCAETYNKGSKLSHCDLDMIC